MNANKKESSGKIDPIPLCVDLDGTLIQSDITQESAIIALKQRFWLLLYLPFWLFKGGIPHCKSQLAKHAEIDYSCLPLNNPVLDYVKHQKEAGRRIILVTGSYEYYAQGFAKFLGIFDDVHATSDTHNLTGHNKAKMLAERYDVKGFDYIGNELKDQYIWQVSRNALFANATAKLLDHLSFIQFHKVFHTREKTVRLIFSAFRTHQWVKNLLVFVPLVTSHSLFNNGAPFSFFIGFMAFNFTASATYIINDLCDLAADRKHDSKRHRPIASGLLSIQKSIMYVLVLFTLTGLLLTLLPIGFAISILTYIILTLTYSLKIKSCSSIDVITLAILFTLRIIGGMAIIYSTDTGVSFWLLAFSMFVFLSLAMVKRVSELINLANKDKNNAKGRDYQVADKAILSQLGTSSGLLAVLILAFYINSPEVNQLYSIPEILWLLCPVFLYWITRVWVKTSRGLVNEDPIVFAIKDKVSLGCGFACAVIMVLANVLS